MNTVTLTKTVDKFQNLRNVTPVTKLSQAAYNRLCVTTNYKLFKIRKENRDGIQEKRVKFFIDRINNNEFDPIMGHIIVNGSDILEGTHRFVACMRTNKPVVFMPVEHRTNSEIAIFNTCPSSAWLNKDNFGSAKSCGSELAIVLDDLRTEFIDKYKLNNNELNIGDMYAILVQNSKYFGSGSVINKAVTVDLLLDTTHVDKARSIGYLQSIDIYASLKRRWVDMHKRYKASKVVMECTFENNKKVLNFDLEQFNNNLQFNSFRFSDKDNTNDFIKEAVRIHNIGLKKSERAIALV